MNLKAGNLPSRIIPGLFLFSVLLFFFLREEEKKNAISYVSFPRAFSACAGRSRKVVVRELCG